MTTLNTLKEMEILLPYEKKGVLNYLDSLSLGNQISILELVWSRPKCKTFHKKM